LPRDGQPGAKVDATVRFSTVAGELGSADTARDIHGFAIKLKTDQGNLDWVLLDTPIFFIRDPGKYPDLVHATKKHPQTNLKDPDMFWVILYLLNRNSDY
jgi:catalase